MALIAKTAPVVAPPSLVQTRAPSPYRPVAAPAGDGPVEALTAANGTDLDFAVSQFPNQDDQRPSRRDTPSHDRDRLPGPPKAFVRTPSEAFAALIELDGAFEGGDPFGAPKKADHSPDAAGITRAISTYEVNERVIYGTEATTGDQVSITL